ncbi:MAG TPA: response regulator [Gemmatimonadales bacterium]|nr:response regulator [Gemmatimonadales bacterium]
MSVPLRVLVVEDSEEDALLLVRVLKRGGYEPIYERVDTASAMKAALERQGWDLVIGDHSMPAFSSTAALALLRELGLDVPFICVSGTISEEQAVATMKAGASDYFAKGQLKRLLPAIARELREAKGRAALRVSEASHGTLVEHAPVGIYRSSPEGRFLSVNAALVRILGYDSAAEVLQLDMTREVYADPTERQRLLDRDTYTDREYDEVEATWKRRDGSLLSVQLSVRAVRNAARHVEYYETFVRDVTEQRRLQQQLVQAQKMEAVGRLAGGIAHDFNNLLTVITSYSDLLLEDLGRDDPKRDDVEQVRKAAEGAASLTRQLLAFSRQQVLEPRVVDLNVVVGGLRKMLQRVIGEDVEFATTLAPDLRAVRADVGQLEQVLMNLAVNARDAMPTGGKLTIETANVELDTDYTRKHHPAAAGHFVMLAVSDTGVGMDEATKARIFEPFFTTKGPGKGTGLGLATVYGIVKQSGGFVWVYSEPGHGTSFKIYLPRLDEPVDQGATSPAAAGVPRGTETVLVVEDAAAVRAVTRQVLERQGYTILEAPNGAAALHLAATHHGPIHLLLTDVVMPALSGRPLAERLTQLRPETRVLYTSGYTDDSIVRHGILEPGIAYLQKPFTPASLARKVRDVLDTATTPRTAARLVPREAPAGSRILLIDDDARLRDAIRRALEQAGHEVVEATDGAAGLQLYRERGADVVILDIFMPERDGLEFIRDLRAEGRQAKIIAISGGGRTGQIDMLKAAAAFGATCTLSKPVALNELLATVHDLLVQGAES